MGEYIPTLLGFDADEKVVYTIVTTDYSGNVLFAFENGKMAKVPVSCYATKTNRKKLIGAYSDKSPLCSVLYLDEEKYIVAFSDTSKALYLNTEKIPLKATKSTQGVQVMTMRKKGSKLTSVVEAKDSKLEKPEQYSSRNIPAAGGVIKDDQGQMSLF